jgi:hypothetical protein
MRSVVMSILSWKVGERLSEHSLRSGTNIYLFEYAVFRMKAPASRRSTSANARHRAP